MYMRLKINEILIFAIIFLNSNCIVQAQSFAKDWQWLRFAETTAGTASPVYENALLNLVANNLKDSLMVSYYDSIATRLNNIIPQIENKYGVTSMQYWNLIDACSVVLTESAHNHVRIKKHKHLISFLKSLELHYQQAEKNEYIFTVGLSDVYSYLGDFNKAIYWGQKRFDFAKKSNNSNELAGAYCILAELYVTHHKDKDFLVFFDKLIGDTEISHQDKRTIINYFLNTNYDTLSDKNKSDITKCILDFEDNRFLNIQALCHEASKHQDYYIFDIIENSKSFSNFSIEDIFDYYTWNSTGFSIYNNPQRCVDYLLKAISFAQSNNRDDLNWHYHGSKSTLKTHNWLWVAYYYEYELFDKTNALHYLEKNLAATKDYYGDNSVNYLNELKSLATKYDLWNNDIKKVAQYDSIAAEVSKKVFGINSEEHATALSSYISCLRRQNHYSKALSMCNDFFSAADSTNVYSHMIYNQAAMCYESLGMNESAVISFIKAIDKTDDQNTKSSYAVNLSSLLVDENNVKAALDFVDKYKPKTDNPIDHYTFLNNKANILANIDRNKAYKTFCEAEQYETSKNVQLLVNRQITHYMNKAKVAPDLHLRFSALQQALKIFDNNNTSDSIMYAHIIAEMADYYNSVMDAGQAALLYKHALDVYIRNSKDISIDALDFCDRAVMLGLSLGYDPQLIYAAEQSLTLRKQMQGEMNNTYILRRFQLLDTYSRFGYDVKADSLAEEIKSAKLPPEYEHERDYYLGLYEQQSRKDLKKAAAYYESYLSSSDSSIAGTRIYGDLMDIYKELGEFDKFDITEDKYISIWYQDVESKWYHITDQERANFLQLLKGWQISLAQYACTPKSIENAVNASLFCKGRLTQTTKAINEELSRLGKNILVSETSQSQIIDISEGSEPAISVSDHIISSPDSIRRSIVYNDLSTKRLKNIINSNITYVKKTLLKGDVAIDFINVDTTTIYAYIIKKDKPIELKRITFTDGVKTLSHESLEDIFSDIKGAKRVFFSPSETMSITPIESFFRSRLPNVEIHRVLNLSDIHKEKSIIIKNVVAIGNPRFNDESTTGSAQYRGDFWQPLPGTKIEIDSISDMFKRYNIKIQAYTGKNATESIIKDFSRKNIDLIHIATHGFFNSENYKSGLLFTGANRGLNGDTLDNMDDGILTCDEIENLHFPNLKLVVLSACDTGLGKTNIDGVWGLQRAFRIAGAKYMIVSLKKVDDELTQSFMINFYKNLTIGKSIYDSFVEAMNNADEDTRNSFILIE